jgi:hypothetical protein
MPSVSPSLSPLQLEELQGFLRDWLRHTGRTQADLRRALRAASIRMPVLIDALRAIHDRQGLAGLAERLCSIEALWLAEESGGTGSAGGPGGAGPADLEGSLSQLDLLLEEIRLEQHG